MLPDPNHLATLLAVIEEGSFEAAARRLHLTPSAVSQRIRALESSAGRVLVRRTTPTEATAEGESFVALARRLRMLATEFEGGRDGVVLRIAVNADSLSTWFAAVMSRVAEHGGVALQLFVEDQAFGRELLRRGEVLAAVTSDPEPVQGCRVEPLATVRYHPVAHPDLLARHRTGHRIDWANLPLVVFNEKDHLQDQVLAAHRVERPAVVHRVPSSESFAQAVRLGLGWGVLPAAHIGPDLVRLPGAKPVDVDLFWHRWRLDLPVLDELTEWVAEASSRRPRSST